MSIALEEGNLIVRETHKGSNGAGYVYIIRGSKLVHISRFFKPTSREYNSITYKVPIQEAKAILGRNAEFVEFSFSHRGYLYPSIIEVDLKTRTLNEEFMQDLKSLERYEFEILGSEYQAIKEYEMKVPPLIRRVWDIEDRLRLDLYIRGPKGEEVHQSPDDGKLTSLVLPKPESRTRSLKEKIRFAHELYVLMLVVDSVLKAPGEERHLWVTHEDEPTLVLKETNPWLTVWYQFSIKDWFEVVKRGMMAMFVTGEEIKKIHVKPDIMIFKGEYHSRKDTIKNPPDKTILIDAKVEMTGRDLRQLQEYRERFSKTFENTDFIVAAIGKIPSNYKYQLERSGYRVIEQVFPDKSGEKEFQETIRDMIKTWRG